MRQGARRRQAAGSAFGCFWVFLFLFLLFLVPAWGPVLQAEETEVVSAFVPAKSSPGLELAGSNVWRGATAQHSLEPPSWPPGWGGVFLPETLRSSAIPIARVEAEEG